MTSRRPTFKCSLIDSIFHLFSNLKYFEFLSGEIQSRVIDFKVGENDIIDQG